MGDATLVNWDLCASVMRALREISVSKTNDLVKIALMYYQIAISLVKMVARVGKK